MCKLSGEIRASWEDVLRKCLALLLVLLALDAPAPRAASQLRFEVRVQSIIEERLQASPHSNQARMETMRKFFTDAGCSGDQLTEQAVPHVRQPNIICVLPGTGDSVIIVGAHFDMVDAGDGVVDNWSGVSLLPSLYDTLRLHPRQHTLIFIAFSGEEQGLLGSEYYVKKLSPDEKMKIHAMINLDTLGLGPTNIWVSHSDKELTNTAYIIADALHLPIYGVNVEQVGSTDSDSFFKRKIPTLSLHSVTQQTYRILHTPEDKLAAIRLDDYYGTYRLVTGCLNFLDTYLSRPKEERTAGQKKTK